MDGALASHDSDVSDGNENVTKQTKVVHVRSESLYISLLSSAKQQREKSRTYTAVANFVLWLCLVVLTWPAMVEVLSFLARALKCSVFLS